MDVISRKSSSNLNPDAPLFVPLAYRAVEEYSSEWWELVQSLPWYREYWLQECYQDAQNVLDFPRNDEFVLPDIDFLFENHKQEEEEEDRCGDLIPMGRLKWHRVRPVESPRYFEKVPKIVNSKMLPRMIQQPR